MDDPRVVTRAPQLDSLLRETVARGTSQDSLMDRARGTLLGLAVGNLLGLPVEGHSRGGIASHFADGVIEIDPDQKRRAMDDDLAQAVDLGEALLGGSDYIYEFARRLVTWRRENGRGIGVTTSAVIDLLERGIPVPEAARQIYERRGRIAPNGGIMRCAPVAIARHRSPEALIRDSAATCVITHYAPACQWSCIILNTALAMLLSGATPAPSDLADAAVSDGAPEEIKDWMERAGDDVITRRLDQGHTGHTLLALQVGLWAMETPLGIEAALIAVVRGGGDTDTNGAVAGAVLGARHGEQCIPRRWLECVPQIERLETLADRLTGAGT